MIGVIKNLLARLTGKPASGARGPRKNEGSRKPDDKDDLYKDTYPLW